MSDVGDDGPRYVLGHSDRELERLAAQARLIDPITRRFFQEAGVSAGMRVLDVGSGAGDVAFMVAEMVGESGEVVGVDRSATAVSAATARVAATPSTNVTFVAGDPAEMAFDSPFDAVVGRYVLQFQADPAAMLRKLAGHLRPGGLVVFHELDWSGSRSFPSAPVFDECRDWMSETIRRSDAEIHMGTKLHATFVAAGLPAPTMRLEALIGSDASGPLQLMAGLAPTLLPTAERLGIAPAGIDPETLLETLAGDVQANGAVVVGNYQVGAWSRV